MKEIINPSFQPITGNIKISMAKGANEFSKPGYKGGAGNSRGYKITDSFNPIPISQPVLYLGAMDPAYMTLGSFSGFNQNVTKLNNYLSGTNTNTLATSLINLNHNPNQVPVPMLLWNNSASIAAQSHWGWGAVSTLNFIHNQNAEYTFYLVVRPLQSENTGVQKVILANAINATEVGFRWRIADTGNNRAMSFLVSNNTSNAVSVVFPSYDNDDINPPVIYSIRFKAIAGKAGEFCGYAYVNGVLYQTITLILDLVAGNASNTLSIGSAPDGSLIYRGYMGEAIIDNRFHDTVTHSNIVNFLKDRYGII